MSRDYNKQLLDAHSNMFKPKPFPELSDEEANEMAMAEIHFLKDSANDLLVAQKIAYAILARELRLHPELKVISPSLVFAMSTLEKAIEKAGGTA